MSILFSINGADFYLSLTDVNRHPNSLLGHPSKRAQYYNPTTGSYFFPRNQDIFPAIHHLYRYPSTVLKRPPFISMERFVEEIEFFQLPPQVPHSYIFELDHSKSLILGICNGQRDLQKEALYYYITSYYTALHYIIIYGFI